MLTLNNVSKNFGKFTAVENISLNMDNGLYALLAPNGAGKTTIIKMITTLLNPTEGEILYDGVNIKTMGAAYRELLGYLPQDFGYYKNNTPKQYLSYLAAFLPCKRSFMLRGYSGMAAVCSAVLWAFCSKRARTAVRSKSSPSLRAVMGFVLSGVR